MLIFRIFLVLLPLMFLRSAPVLADATSNANPTMVMKTAVPLAACTQNFEEATSASGRTLKCVAGVWTYQGVTDIERVFVTQNIVAADVGTYKTLAVYCPAGKRVLDGGCALLSGMTYHERQNLFMDMVFPDLSGRNCGYGPLTASATDPYYFFGWNNAGISAEVYCGVY